MQVAKDDEQTEDYPRFRLLLRVVKLSM